MKTDDDEYYPVKDDDHYGGDSYSYYYGDNHTSYSYVYDSCGDDGRDPCVYTGKEREVEREMGGDDDDDFIEY